MATISRSDIQTRDCALQITPIISFNIHKISIKTNQLNLYREQKRIKAIIDSWLTPSFTAQGKEKEQKKEMEK